MNKLIKKIIPLLFPNKQKNELLFWKGQIEEYVYWYRGISKLYGENPPSEKIKINNFSETENAILTWLKVHQEKKYARDLKLEPGSMKKMKVLDIGSGPFPSGLIFNPEELYCLDPLLPKYIEIGFPIHHFNKAKFVFGKSEYIPFKNNFFDAIISVNAIDHVDDINKTAQEIKRVLKPDGKLRMHVHYHPPTPEEPIELNDKKMKALFGWCKGFKKINQSNKKHGTILKNDKEKYTVWSN